MSDPAAELLERLAELRQGLEKLRAEHQRPPICDLDKETSELRRVIQLYAGAHQLRPGETTCKTAARLIIEAYAPEQH